MARCLKPFYTKQGVPAPCGKCQPCMLRRASAWSFRILKEAERLGSAFFVTLTYAPEQVPKAYCEKAKVPKGRIRYDRKKEKFIIEPRAKAVYVKTKRLTADIHDLQKFIKRLRKSNHAKEIKYYGVSEYGDETWRPHYHVILLGIDIVSFVGLENWEKIQRGAIKLDGESQMHVDSWKKGHITIGDVSNASVMYTLKYIAHGRKIPQYKGDDRQKERSLMSKGMGLCYITPEIEKLHRNDIERQYCVTNESKKIPLPRYLKDRLYDSLERQYMSDIYAAKYFMEREELGQFERKKHELSVRVNPDKERKSTIGRKNKI